MISCTRKYRSFLGQSSSIRKVVKMKLTCKATPSMCIMDIHPLYKCIQSFYRNASIVYLTSMNFFFKKEMSFRTMTI
jgi:hypothetical protein